ncbi:MAG: lipopolysaccharide biosynthesis protein, partial [Oscillospiraceae bacterium]
MKLLSRFKKSEYAKNSTILMAGTVFSMVIQVISMGWLGKFYNADFFGLFEYFSTAYSILLIVATGRYELAIMLPKDDNDGFLVTILSASLSVGFSIIAEIGLLLYSFIFKQDLDWIAFLPITLAVLGIYYSINYWLNRKKCYIKLALNRVIQGILFVTFNILYAFILKDKRYGLILGYLTAQTIVMVIFVIYFIHDYKKMNLKFNFSRMKELAKKHINFPRLTVASGVINNLASRIPVFLLGIFGGTAVVGQYSMMNRILGAPITAIAEAIRDVFRQRASKDYAENGECKHAYDSTFKTLALTAIVPFTLLMFITKPALNLIFGDIWNMAADFVIIMSPFYYVRFVVTPLSFMTFIAQKQSFDMKWQILYCLSAAIAFVLGNFIFHTVYAMLIFYGIAMAILYIYNYSYTKKLSKGKPDIPV